LAYAGRRICIYRSCGVAGATLGGLISMLAVNHRARMRKAPAVQAAQTLESRLAALGETMGNASELLVLVETELKAREEKARQLAAEVKRSEQLALLTQEQKEAVKAVLRGEVVAEGRKANSLAFLYGFGFFLAGSVVTYLFTYVHH
jgi:hypothetical protein